MENLLKVFDDVKNYKFYDGDEIPEELCNIIKNSQCLVLCTLFGIIIPDPITLIAGPILGISMYNKNIKKKIIRYIANNFCIRLKRLDEENLLRYEINIGFENWLPLFVFSNNQIIIENDSFSIKQSSQDKLFGPIISYGEEIIRSNGIISLSNYLGNLTEENISNDIDIIHIFRLNNSKLEHTIKIIKENNIISESKRVYMTA